MTDDDATALAEALLDALDARARTAALAVPCATCKAPPGTPCHYTGSGRTMTHAWHLTRDAARQR